MNLWQRLFSRRQREQELHEEIRAHFAMAVRDRVERGEDPREAEFAVRREFGNRALVEETTRDIWGWTTLGTVWQDIAYALRGMKRNPGFTAIVIASLALGIGANTAIFSLVETVMLRMLPVRQPEQLVELLQKYPGEPRMNGGWLPRGYEHIRDNNHVFSTLTGMSVDNRVRLTNGSDSAIVVGESVLGNYFQGLGVEPALGRLITPADDPANPDGAVAVVSWSWWTTHMNQDPHVLGKRILVQDVPATIVGVAPRSYTGLRVEAQTSVWVPRSHSPQGGIALFGRLKPGTSIEQARAEIAVLYRAVLDERAAHSNDPQLRQMSVQLEPAGNGASTVRDRFGKPLTVLMTVVGLLLLLACVNIASLMLARGAARQHELALRANIGASRFRLLRQVLTESIILSALGAAAGAGVAWFGTSALVRILASGRPHEQLHLNVQPDMAVLLFATGIAVAVGLFFGLLPALMAFHAEPMLALRPAGASTESRFRRYLGKGLVAAQVAISMLLLSAAGLFVGNLQQLKNMHLGFTRDHVLLVSLEPARNTFSNEQLVRAYQQLLEKLGAVPGVRSVTMSAPTPLHGAGASGFANVEGFVERTEDRRWISISYVAPKYFETLGTPLLAGREFSLEDQVNPRIAIINESMARYYFEGRNPIGKHVTMYNVTLRRDTPTYEIVGVSGDAHYMEIREPARRSIYLPAFTGERVIGNTFVIRTAIPPESITGDVRRVVQSLSSSISISQATTLTDQIDASIVPERLIATLSGFFAVLGALLAGLGLYGLLAYTLARRTSEIGIRVALGATRGNVIGMVVRDASVMVLTGIALGIPLAMWGRRLAAMVTQDLAVSMPFAVLTSIGVLLGIAMIASYIPARRAVHIHPIEALRYE